MNLELIFQTPGVKKWIKWAAILLLLKQKAPFSWASFLSLNSLIKGTLREISTRSNAALPIDKLSNAVSSTFLLSALTATPGFPRDYLVLYLYLTWIKIGSIKDKTISPKLASFTSNFDGSRVFRWIHNNKSTLIFSLLSGQILSNYLTPNKKLNHKYLNNSLKSYILNPIWINFSLGGYSHAINWSGLAKQYLKLQLILLVINGFSALKSFEDIKSKWKEFLHYTFHKANAYTNLIFIPNLLAILLLVATSPFFNLVKSPYKKSFLKVYTKSIGFIVSFATLYANSVIYDSTSPRLISTSFLLGLNVHLTRFILLSKWRISKDTYGRFKKITPSNWIWIESIIATVGTWSLLNTYDDVKNKYDKDSEEIKKDRVIGGVKKIMS